MKIINQKTWRLDETDQLASAYKYTFYKSSLDTIQMLRPNDLTKLIVLFERSEADAPSAERL